MKPTTINDLSKEVNSYEETVLALLAFVHEMSWDPNTKSQVLVEHGHGKPHQPEKGDSVTPDVSLKFASQEAVLGEVKIGFSGRVRDEARKQLICYDSVISRGKSDGLIVNGGTVLIVHYTRKSDAIDYLEREHSIGQFCLANAFAIISSVRVSQNEDFISLEKVSGKMVPDAKDKQLSRVRSIGMRHLLRYGIKFYDAPPPMALLLSVMWTVLHNCTPEDEHERALRARRTGSGSRYPKASASVQFIQEELQKHYGLRQLDDSLPCAPLSGQVRKALDRFVAWGLAAKTNEQYNVELKDLQPSPFEFFLQQLADESPQSQSGDQLGLPGIT